MMKRISTVLFADPLLLTLGGCGQESTVPAVSAAHGAATVGGGDRPSISNVSGSLTHGSTLTINGSGFGSHADYGGSEDFLPWDVRR